MNNNTSQDDLKTAFDAFTSEVDKEYRRFQESPEKVSVPSESLKESKAVMDAVWIKYFDIDELILDTSPAI
ncbi:MAG TPA: hypothetical protein EYP92_01300 [Candidatus Thioglobus sp.]|jgi:hypothetical protein|nr:hypothetical protein [Candidatus Thioglobus sp.]